MLLYILSTLTGPSHKYLVSPTYGKIEKKKVRGRKKREWM